MLFKTCIRGNIQYEMIKKVFRKIKRILKKGIDNLLWREIQGNYKKIDTINIIKTDAAVISLVDFSLVNYSDEYRKKINILISKN